MATWTFQQLHGAETTQVMMKLGAFDYIGAKNALAKFGFNPTSIGVAPHIRELYTSCDFSSSFIFLRTYTGQTDGDDMTQFGARECPPDKCFLTDSINSFNCATTLFN